MRVYLLDDTLVCEFVDEWGEARGLPKVARMYTRRAIERASLHTATKWVEYHRSGQTTLESLYNIAADLADNAARIPKRDRRKK